MYTDSILVQSLILECPNDDHHRVATKTVSKVKRGKPATSVHGLVIPFKLASSINANA